MKNNIKNGMKSNFSNIKKKVEEEEKNLRRFATQREKEDRQREKEEQQEKERKRWRRRRRGIGKLIGMRTEEPKW